MANGYATKKMPTDVYNPGCFIQDHKLDTTGLSEIPFGREMKKEFGLREDTIFLNHGSFGAVPNRVLKLQHDYNKEREEHPDLFFRLTSKQYMDKTRVKIASMINADVENVMIVSNATTAMNLLIKNFPFKSGEAILDTTQSYGSVKNLVKDYSSRIRPDVECFQMEISFPIESEEEIISKYEDFLEKHPNIKVAIIDYITSPTAVELPVARLVKLCHSRGVLAFIDGAHTIGQLPLDMKALQADAVLSSVHKWCYSPRGVALLWFAEAHRGWINPPNTSWQIAEPLDFQFFDQGTRDHVPLICARHGIQFYEAVGGMDKVVGYTSKLADDARNMLCQELGLESLQIPRSMEAPNMKCIRLPSFPKYPITPENVWVLQRDLFGGSNIFAVLVPMQGYFYIRISTQIYNEMEDFIELAKLLKAFIEKNAQE